jgi:rSAM/selenodomain-associated transferase 2
MTQPTISIIIPVLNEAAIIQSALKQLKKDLTGEIIVVDGGSQDNTVALAQEMGVKVIISIIAGRAQQMNAGAAVAKGEILLFLHADTQLPSGYCQTISKLLAQDKVIAGAFSLTIDGQQKSLRLVEMMVNWRSRLLSLPYGDQGIFLSKTAFEELGGFADLAIMEDFEFVQRLKRRGKIAIASTSVITSSRRWHKLGVLRTTLINQLMVIGYYLGISPKQLKIFYQNQSLLPKYFR